LRERIRSLKQGEIEMDEIQLFPQEASEAGEASEQVENQSLNDATFEPRAYVEQTGDYRQAEAVQNSFTAVVDSVVSQTNEATGVSPLPAPAGETGFKEQVGDIPTPLPSPVEEIGQKCSSAGTTEVAETPLPAPAGESGYRKEQVGDIPMPLPSPVEEIGQKYSVAGTTEVAETPLPATAMESGFKEQVGVLPTPLPSPAEEIGQKYSVAGTTEGAETPLPAPAGESGYRKEQVGDIPMPIPSPAEEIGNEISVKGMTSDAETSLPGTATESTYKETVEDLPMPLPRPAGEVGRNEIESVVIDHMVTRVLDGLSDLTSEKQLKLQEMMEKKTQVETTLSNILKSFENTQRDLVANLK
jgi:hypothetical protein